MDKIITIVAKNTNVKKSRVHNVINKNLEKLNDEEQIYKFVANQCKGMINKIGLCWGISLIQFISPISEDIEIDNILSVLNKYCYRSDGGGATTETSFKFLYNFSEELRKVDKKLIAMFSSDLYTSILTLKPAKAKFPLYNVSFNEENIIVAGYKIKDVIIYNKKFDGYEIYSMIINIKFLDNKLLGHAISIRLCNNQLLLFDNNFVRKLKNITFSNILDNINVIKYKLKSWEKKGNIKLELIAVLLKNKNHKKCLELISKKYKVDEIYINNF